MFGMAILQLAKKLCRARAGKHATHSFAGGVNAAERLGPRRFVSDSQADLGRVEITRGKSPPKPHEITESASPRQFVEA